MMKNSSVASHVIAPDCAEVQAPAVETPKPLMKSFDGEKPDRAMTKEEELIWEKSSSAFNYYAGYYSNSAIILWLLSRSFWWGTVPKATTFAAVFFSGFFVWTFFEYWFHRALYHYPKQTTLVIGHGMHHESPRALLGIPFYYTAMAYLTIFYGISQFVDPTKLSIFMGAFWLGYISYNGVHHGTHHWKFRNRIFKFMKAHHNYHHHHDDKNFAITFPPWDYVFRTHKRVKF